MKLHLILFLVALAAVALALSAWAVATFKNAKSTPRPVIGNANRKFYRSHMRRFYLAPLLIQRIFGFLPGQVSPRGTLEFANIGEGTFGEGRVTLFGDATTSTRYLLYKIGSDADHVALAGAGDTPLGPSDDMVADVTVPIAINLLGPGSDTLRVVTDGSISNGDYVKCGAAGVAVKATTSGTDVVIGRAVFGSDTSNGANDVITIVPIMPCKHPF